MESSNLDRIANVIWNVLEAPLTYVNVLLSYNGFAEGLALVAFGIAAIIAMRRYQTSLASARKLQPGAAAEIQQALRPLGSAVAPARAARKGAARANQELSTAAISAGNSHAA